MFSSATYRHWPLVFAIGLIVAVLVYTGWARGEIVRISGYRADAHEAVYDQIRQSVVITKIASNFTWYGFSAHGSEALNEAIVELYRLQETVTETEPASGWTEEDRVRHSRKAYLSSQIGRSLNNVSTAVAAFEKADRLKAPIEAVPVMAITSGELLPLLAELAREYHYGRARVAALQSRVDITVFALLPSLALGLLAIWLLSQRERDRRLRQTGEQMRVISRSSGVGSLPNALALTEHAAALPIAERAIAISFEYKPITNGSRDAEFALTSGFSAALAERLRALPSFSEFSFSAEVEPGVEPKMLGHMGVGRFSAVICPAPEAADLDRLLEDIQGLTEEPLALLGIRLGLEATVGIAESRANRSAHKVIENANLALSAARAAGGTEPFIYTPSVRREASSRKRVAADLQVGLMSGQIVSFFQPQMSISDGRVLGFEALARWQHPRRGLLAPGAFIPLAEDYGLDVPLGEVMLRHALAALNSWDAAGFEVEGVSVNVSRSQLTDRRLVDLLKWELDRASIDPERLSVEVLETVHTKSDEDPIVQTLRAIGTLGVRISLDDYGTGTASITGIRRYGANCLKIDRSYVSDLDTDFSKRSLVGAIVNMAEDLHISSLAEGVETESELQALRALKCGAVQGYFIGKPMTLEDTHRWLAEHRESPHVASA